MQRSSLVGHVVELAEILLRDPRQPADGTVAAFFRSRRYLGSRDRRFIAELVYDLVRNAFALSADVRAVLRTVGHEPPSEALPAVALLAFSLVRVRGEDPALLAAEIAPFWQRAFPSVSCGAFLAAARQVPRTAETITDDALRIGLRHSMPGLLVREWVERIGAAAAEELCAALNAQAPVTIRVNSLKCTVQACRAALLREGVEAWPTRFSPSGLLLGKRLTVGSLAAFRSGWFEMQDEGSQIISLLASPVPGDAVIDACAGGGGKTLHLAALMEDRGTLLALDREERRLMHLHERAARAGVTIARTGLAGESARAREWSGRADIVVVDAPCTGSGTYRRNPAAKLALTEADVANFATTQSALLETYAAWVRPGGRLVYATCSLLKRENQEVVADFLQRHPEYHLRHPASVLASHGVTLPLDAFVPTSRTQKDEGEVPAYLQLLPSLHGADGFFGAVLDRRNGP